MNRRVPTIAVVTSNSLMGVGLCTMLREIIPFAVVEACDLERLRGSSAEEFFHIFASANLVLENSSLFDSLTPKTILLTNGSAIASVLGDYIQIDISKSAESIRGQLLALHSSAHRPSEGHNASNRRSEVLTPREVEVLKLLVEGLLNKEIAHQLSIGLSTVISHRKNIVEKLGIRSLSGLTIYAVMKGYLEI